VIKIELRIPETFEPRARYALAQLALAWGLPARFVTGGAAGGAVLVYGDPGRRRPGDALFVPFDAELYEPATRCETAPLEGVTVWVRQGVAPGAIDLVGGAYRLLALLDESQIEEAGRSRRGTFLCAALPEKRQTCTAEPLVEHHAAILFERLRTACPALADACVPRWPNGKRWVTILTHDTDAVRIGAPAEIATNLGKAILRRDPIAIEMIRLGLRHGRAVTGNPLFGFPGWGEFERARGVRSAFYLFAAMPGKPRDLNDCKSSVLDPGTDWGLLRAMAGDGWEFGLHPPIHAKDDIDVFLWCKRTIEERLGSPIQGLRHHYWALDWRRPHLTYRKHVNAGFRYDASIAWLDRPGFRAGTSLPFRPFDPGRERALDLVVLPTSLMDGHVIGNAAVGPPAPAASALFDAARDAGGMVVLDWHTESSCDRLRYPRFLTTLGEILAPVFADPSCWFATPWEVVSHWHRRRMAIEAAAHETIEVGAGGPAPVAAPRALKVGLLGMPDNEATPALLRELEANGIHVQTIVYWRPAARDQWKRVMNKLRAAGISGVLTRAGQALARKAGRPRTAPGDALPEPFPNARRFEVPHHNSDECRDLLKREGVDVLIVATDAILTRKVFLAPRIATLNGHPGWVPAFRGLGSAYHQMRHGWPPAVSIHQVDEGIDTGPAYVREWLDVRTVAPEQIEAELTRLRGRLFARVIDALARGEAKPIDMFLEPSGMTRGMPLAERRELERKLRAGRALNVPRHLCACSSRAGYFQDNTP